MIDYAAASLILTAIVSLTLFSIAYRDNALFRVMENIIVGLGIGSLLVVGIERVYSLAVKKIMAGQAMLIAPLVLGFMAYLIYSRRYSWIGRIPLAMMAALGLAYSARGLMAVNFVAQIQAMMVPVTDLYNLVMIIGASSSLFYFFYSVEHKGPVGGVARLGRLFLMLTFGCFLAQGYFGYNSRMIGVWQNILQPPATYVIPIAAVLLAIDVGASKMGILWRRAEKVETKAQA